MNAAHDRFVVVYCVVILTLPIAAIVALLTGNAGPLALTTLGVAFGFPVFYGVVRQEEAEKAVERAERYCRRWEP